MVQNAPAKKNRTSPPGETAEHRDDYVFRFKIEPREQILNPDTLLAEFYKEQIIDLLKIVFFSRDGKKLLPNEFGFLNEPDKKYPLAFTE